MLDELKLTDGNYFLVTAHRPRNVDKKDNFNKILSALGSLHERYGVPVVYPMHPRSKKMLNVFGLKAPNGVKTIDAVGYLEFLQLMSHARLVLTDSGGIQEEACILRVPCVTLRENTERPETLEVGSNMLAGVDSKKILDSVEAMLSKRTSWDNPFGDGKATDRIMRVLLSE